MLQLALHGGEITLIDVFVENPINILNGYIITKYIKVILHLASSNEYIVYVLAGLMHNWGVYITLNEAKM